MLPKPKDGRRHTLEELEDHRDAFKAIARRVNAEYATRDPRTVNGAMVGYAVQLNWLRYCGLSDAKIKERIGDPPPAPAYTPPVTVPAPPVELPDVAPSVSSAVPMPVGAGASPAPASAAPSGGVTRGRR